MGNSPSSRLTIPTALGAGGRGMGLRIGDRIVWLREDKITKTRSDERGAVRWIGTIDEELIAGVELDEKLDLGSGWYDNKQLFTCEPGHGALIFVGGLIHERDYNCQQNMDAFNWGNANGAAANQHDVVKSAPLNPDRYKTGLKIGSQPLPEPSSGSDMETERDLPEKEKPTATTAPEDKNRFLSEEVEMPVEETDEEPDKIVTTVEFSNSGMAIDVDGGSGERFTDPIPTAPAPACPAAQAPRPEIPRHDPPQYPYSDERSPQNPRSRTQNPRSRPENARSRSEHVRFEHTPLFPFSDEPSPQNPHSRRQNSRSRQQRSQHVTSQPFSNFRSDPLQNARPRPAQNPDEPKFNNHYHSPTATIPTTSIPTTDPYWIHPPLASEDGKRVEGKPKGIQGWNNSCYLDSTLFCMFSFSSVFDSILLRPQPQPLQNHDQDQQQQQQQQQHPEGTNPNAQNVNVLGNTVQTILRTTIVNPLRKHLFVPYGNVLKLRESLKDLNANFVSEEMDPQEFLQILFHQVFKLPEFLALSLGQNDYFHQVLVPISEDDDKKLPTVQFLLHESMDFQGLKFKSVPNPALILQMPRSGNKHRTYSGILPNLTIDITDLLVLDEQQALAPPGESGIGDRPRVQLDLVAVICIATNHFVSFVRTGTEDKAPWVFFDSMAIQSNPLFDGRMIPCVEYLEDFGNWLGQLASKPEESLVDFVGNLLDPAYDDIKRLISDGYMCFYAPSKSNASP